jgi:type II secretory pathway pseudopilin PulG
MRKTNVFGRKVSHTKVLYIIVIIFVIIVGSYYSMIRIQDNRLEELQQQEIVLQDQIDDLLETSQLTTYHDVGQIIQYLPNTYNQLGIINEINFVKNLSGLSLASSYSLSLDEQAVSPFEQNLPATVKFVKISLSMTIDDPALILDFIDNLLSQDQIYYIDTLSVSYTNDFRAIIQMTIYTFYNDVELS